MSITQIGKVSITQTIPSVKAGALHGRGHTARAPQTAFVISDGLWAHFPVIWMDHQHHYARSSFRLLMTPSAVSQFQHISIYVAQTLIFS